jgi:hypothetical protein
MAGKEWHSPEAHILVARKQRDKYKKGPGKDIAQGNVPNSLLSPARSHFLKLPVSPKIAPPARYLGFNT